MASVVDDSTAFVAIWYMPYMSTIIPLFDIETIPVLSAGTCKANIDAYEHGLNDGNTEALKRQGRRGIRGRVATEEKPEIRQVRSQEARSRGPKL